MTDYRTIRAAAVQISPDLDLLAGTVDRVLAAIAEAASKGAELIVFSETFLPWYPYFSIAHSRPRLGTNISVFMRMQSGAWTSY
jgi:aliphatic nitrilase